MLSGRVIGDESSCHVFTPVHAFGWPAGLLVFLLVRKVSLLLKCIFYSGNTLTKHKLSGNVHTSSGQIEEAKDVLVR